MKDEVLDRLEHLRRYLRQLREFEPVSKEELESDMVKRGAVERYLHLSLETVIDIASMVIAHEAEERPDSYREALRMLGRHGVLGREFAERFSDAAGFRNILVHGYTDVDLDEVVEVFDRLDDFETFARSIVEYLE